MTLLATFIVVVIGVAVATTLCLPPVTFTDFRSDVRADLAHLRSKVEALEAHVRRNASDPLDILPPSRPAPVERR